MSAIDDLTSELARLPGIGRKTALRLTYHLLKQPPEQSRRLAHALQTLSDKVRPCARCFNLTEEELCTILDADPLTLLSGQLDHRPELAILGDLLAEAEERAGAAVLRRWVRASGPAGRPVDQLLRRDFAAFEDSLATLAARGFVLRAGG